MARMFEKSTIPAYEKSMAIDETRKAKTHTEDREKPLPPLISEQHN